MKNELLYQISLTLIEGIGDVTAKALLAYCGSASEVFKQKKLVLQKIPGIGNTLASAILKGKAAFQRAEQEIRFIEKQQIQALFFTDPAYPQRLKYCNDSPILLYYKGQASLNTEKIVAVVGTRKPSDYGKKLTEDFVNGLAGSGIMVISGLAYGVDVLAHKTALDKGLETIGVLGHGLDRLYPSFHEGTAKKMQTQGGLLTDFMSETNPDAVNFPKRNRIVAGLCDALVVVESKRTGGSLITATIASSYNKDVFAFPGKANDPLAEGCNGLIKQNKAALIENTEDLLYAMQWQKTPAPSPSTKQLPLLLSLSEEENKILALFEQKNPLHIDEICHASRLSSGTVATYLLQLEFNNLIKSRPGKLYEYL